MAHCEPGHQLKDIAVNPAKYDIPRIDTCDLLKLRKVLVDATTDEVELIGLPGLRDALTPLRYEYLNTRLRDDVAIFMCVWKFFSTIDPNHTLHIPPLYRNPTTELLIQDFVKAARLREVPAALQEAHPIGHIVISGVEGTGKTTLLKAFAIAVAALSQSWFLVYVDYTQLRADQTPRRLAAELYVRVVLNCYSGRFAVAEEHEQSLRIAAGMERVKLKDVNAILHSLADPTKSWLSAYIGIACDNIHQQLVPHSDSMPPLLEQHLELLRRLHDFARFTVGSLLILSGCAADLRSRLFRGCRRTGYELYTSFNGTLCKFYHMSALRTVEELKEYIRFRDPDPPHNYERILHETGGIGRLVHAYITDGTKHARKYDPLSQFTNLETGLAVIASLIRRHQATIDEDRKLELFISDAKAGKESYLEPSAVSIPYKKLEEDLIKFTARPVKDVLEDLVDHGVLHLTCTNPRTYDTVQLAIPADAAVYYLN